MSFCSKFVYFDLRTFGRVGVTKYLISLGERRYTWPFQQQIWRLNVRKLQLFQKYLNKIDHAVDPAV